MPQIYRPIPRRTFDLTPASPESSLPPSPPTEPVTREQTLDAQLDREPPPSRTRSILNLTASTLTGIYSAAVDGREDINTPWGTGSQTPIQRVSTDHDMLSPSSFTWGQSPSWKPRSKPTPVRKPPTRTFKQYYAPLLIQTVMLFGFGVGFGSLLTHVHKTQNIAPVPVPVASHHSYYFQIGWGLLGLIIGNALPRIDSWFEDEEMVEEGFDSQSKHFQHRRASSVASRPGREKLSAADDSVGPLWYSTVRSIGAFIGIAYALVSYKTRHLGPFTNSATAQDPMAIHPPGLHHPSNRQSSTVVSDRPLQVGLCRVRSRQRCRHIFVAAVRPAIRPNADDLSRTDLGETGSIHLAREHLVLHELVFWSHR